MKPVVTAGRTQQNTVSILMPTLNPVKDIKAPANTTGISFKLRVATCSLADDNSLSSTAKQFTVAYDNSLMPEQEIELPITLATGNLTVVMLALEYTVRKKGVKQILKDINRMPAGVVGSMWS